MIMALSSVLMTGLAANSGMNPLLAILVGLAVCVAFGVLNGWLTTAIGLPSFIVTLGTFNIAYALVRIYTTATITSVPDPMLFFGETFGIGSTQISYGSILMLALFVVAGFVLSSTRAGRAYRPRSPTEAVRRGIALVNEDRKAHGLFLKLNVTTNTTISALKWLCKAGIIQRAKEKTLVQRMIKDLRIKTPNADRGRAGARRGERGGDHEVRRRRRAGPGVSRGHFK
jgi:hypothetical protein